MSYAADTFITVTITDPMRQPGNMPGGEFIT